MQRPDNIPSFPATTALPSDADAGEDRAAPGSASLASADRPAPPPPPALISYEVLAQYAAWRKSKGAQSDDSAKIRRRLVERFQAMPPRELRALGTRVAATVRELGITAPGAEQPGSIGGAKQLLPGTDIMPYVFAQQEWEFISKGVSQRLQALDHFLQDIYGERQILRDRHLPVDVILGSPLFELPLTRLAPPRAPYIHFGGLALARNSAGEWLVRQHMTFEPTGLSGMVQNRRILARVASEAFTDLSVVSVAETPWQLLESLRELSPRRDSTDPMVVLLTPGPACAAYQEHIFLGRRMGIPVVQGNELLVLRDKLYLKTVRGLRQVDVVLNRLRDEWLDPMVFRSNSVLGVPGLIHCVRKGSVAVVNRPGAQLAEDRALLPFASAIIRYYLGQQPLLKSAPAFWLGDPDQRAEALEDLAAYDIYPLSGGQPLGSEKPSATGGRGRARQLDKIREQVLRNPSNYVAQQRFEMESAPCLIDGRMQNLPIEHRLYALRNGDYFDVLPGALTRSAGKEGVPLEGAYALKDTWVLNQNSGTPIWQSRLHRHRRIQEHNREITSKEAESFYWLGRYLERANILGYMLNVVETMEAEELTPAERALYRPTWNRLLPPLLSGETTRRRGLSTPENRYRLLLQPDEPGSVANMIERIVENAAEVQESITPLAWDALIQMRREFRTSRFRLEQPAAEMAAQTSHLTEVVLRLVPQFFALCQDISLLDDGWRFCSLGKFLERATTSANASSAMINTLRAQITSPGWQQVRYDIELSAFLRMMSSRDAYYRVYQMRADPVSVLRILWSHPDAPRSVFFSLQRCIGILLPMPETVSGRTVEHVGQLISSIECTDWAHYFAIRPEDTIEPAAPEGYNREKAEEMRARAKELGHRVEDLLKRIMQTHNLMSDAFLTHQESIAAERNG